MIWCFILTASSALLLDCLRDGLQRKCIVPLLVTLLVGCFRNLGPAGVLELGSLLTQRIGRGART